MLAKWFVILLTPFTTVPMPVLQADPVMAGIARDPPWLRPRCLSIRCGDAEWREEIDTAIAWNRHRTRKPLPGSRTRLPLRAPTARRDWHGAYSNDWRIGTRHGYQVVREADMRLGIELGAGYRLAPMYDDGVSIQGPVFRGGIDLGRSFGERAQWSQRVQFEAGNGERFVRQAFGLDVDLDDEWRLETDYVIRYDSQGASGSETAEAWLGVRREF